MLSAKKLAKKQKKAVARREETDRLIAVAVQAMRELLDRGVRRSGRPICVNTKTGESK